MPGGQLLLVEEGAQLKWVKKPPTTRKSTAKLSRIAKVQGRLEPALASGEGLRVKRYVGIIVQ